jgi:hypothetical protein
LPFEDGAFDCVHAQGLFGPAGDLSAGLSEAYRVLREGGVLVTALPAHALKAWQVCEDPAGKITREALLRRLVAAGFANVRLSGVESGGPFDLSSYFRSRDRLRHYVHRRLLQLLPARVRLPESTRLAYVTAWKRERPFSELCRAMEAMSWVYGSVRPGTPGTAGVDPLGIIAGGTGLCIDYCIALGMLLKNEGYDVQWVTMAAHDHPHGRGPERRDTHEVLEATFDGKTVTLDPMANTCHPHRVEELLRDPGLARAKASPDERYLARNYELYDTAEWYRRVVQYKLRREIVVPEAIVPWRRNPTWGAAPELARGLSGG